MKYFLLFSIFFYNCSILAQFTISSNDKKLAILVSKKENPNEIAAANYFSSCLKELVNTKSDVIFVPNKKFKTIVFKTDEQISQDAFTIHITKNRLIITGGTRNGCMYAVIHLLEHFAGCRYFSPDLRIFPKQSQLNFPIQTITDQPDFENRIVNIYFPHDEEFLNWQRLNTIESLFPTGFFVHTFPKFLVHPKDNVMNENCMATIHGKKNKNQLCPSHPDSYENIIAVLTDAMAKEPNRQIWSVSQEDNEFYCQCNSCLSIIEEEESPAGPIVRLVNKVADYFPNKTISTLAYQYSRKAPKTAPKENVQIMLCSIELLRDLPIEQQKEAAFVEDMIAWSKLTKNIFLWDYTINFDHSLSPFPNLHTLQPNILFFKKYGTSTVYEQSNSTHGYEFSELKQYLLSKLMWDAEADFQKEYKAFIEAYYGKAAPLIAEYQGLLEQDLLRSKARLWIYESPTVLEETLYSEENVKNWEIILNDAEKRVADEPLHLQHVRELQLGLQYVQLEIACKQVVGPRGWYRSFHNQLERNENMFALFEKFENTCKMYSVPDVNEKYLPTSTYCSGIKRIADIDRMQNLAYKAQIEVPVLPSEKYASGNITLINNGVKGGYDFKQNWLGWNGTDASFIFELSEPTALKKLETSFFIQHKSWILCPENITVFTSTDKTNWKKIGESNETIHPKLRDGIVDCSIEFEQKEPCTFIKIIITGSKKLPEWHAYKGYDSWFFIDDVRLY